MDEFIPDKYDEIVHLLEEMKDYTKFHFAADIDFFKQEILSAPSITTVPAIIQNITATRTVAILFDHAECREDSAVRRRI